MILQGDGRCRGEGRGSTVLDFESHGTKFGHGEGRRSACNQARGLVGALDRQARGSFKTIAGVPD